ncbi:MAG: YncE family protein [Bacteroidia bacterium]
MPRGFLFLVGVILFWSCQRLGDPWAYERDTGFPMEVKRILVPRCAGCHMGSSASFSEGVTHGHSNLSLPVTLDFSSWEGLFRYLGPTPPVVPFSSEWSYLLWVTNPDSSLGPVSPHPIPLGGAGEHNKLSVEEYEVLRRWIAQGAPNKEGVLPYAESFTRTRGKVFVCASGSDKIAVFDTRTQRLMHLIDVGIDPAKIEAPHYIQFSPDKKYVYVTLIGGSAIEKYTTDTYQKVGRVAVASDPAHIEFRSDGKRAVVTHFSDTEPVKLTLLDTETMQVLDELRDAAGLVITRPHGLALTEDFRFAYVTANAGNYLAKVEISPAGDQFISFTQIPLAPGETPQPSNVWGPYQILFLPEGLYAVSCDTKDEVRLFDRQDRWVATIPTPKAPKLMAYAQGLLWVACLKESAPQFQGDKVGAIATIDIKSKRLKTVIYDVGHLPRGIGIDTLEGRVWVSLENLGGIDPPHHYTEGVAASIGKVTTINAFSLNKELTQQMPLASYGLGIIP